MKKFLVTGLCLAMCLGLLSGCGSASKKNSGPEELEITENNLLDLNDYLWDTEHAATTEEALSFENQNYAYIQAFAPLFEESSYEAYIDAATEMRKTKTQESINAAVTARYAMKQETTVADRILFIWDGVEMPVCDGEDLTEEELNDKALLGAGYETVVVKYLLDDPSQAKGNIVACSGGAMSRRSNENEGYPAAKVFNDLGYNYFLVQRRVEPYSNLDIYMDFGRAIRYVRALAEKENYGGQDMIAGLGWSGGAATLMGAVNFFYGDVQFSDYDSDYVPDDIDSYSMDLDVAMPIYGYGNDYTTSANTHFPAFYICQGTADTTVDPAGAQTFYDFMKDKVPCKLNYIEGAEHGFGVGSEEAEEYFQQSYGTSVPAACAEWPADADAFMQENLGFSTK